MFDTLISIEMQSITVQQRRDIQLAFCNIFVFAILILNLKNEIKPPRMQTEEWKGASQSV